MISEPAGEALLRQIDAERQAAGDPAWNGQVVRQYAGDGSECMIVYSRCSPESLDAVISGEMRQAAAQGCGLEWKVYAHDQPKELSERLIAAGFDAEPVENVMVMPADTRTLSRFKAPACEIVRIHDAVGLEAVASISRAIGRTNVEAEKARLGRVLEDSPEDMSIYVAYIEGTAVACGRVHFAGNSEFAELCGGRTIPQYRRRGLYTALVAARTKEAIARGRKYLLVDALPTSEPILRKRGFEVITQTQPFIFRPGRH